MILKAIDTGVNAYGAYQSGQAQKEAAEKQYQLGQQQLALQEKLYNNALDVSREVSGNQISTANNTFNQQSAYAGQQLALTNNLANAYMSDSAGANRDTRNTGMNLAWDTRSDAAGANRDFRNTGMNLAWDTRLDSANANRDMRDTGMGLARGVRGRSMGLAGNTRDQQIGQFQPYADSGGLANAAMNYELGLAGRPEGYSGFNETPGYEFMRDEATRAVDGSAAARGGLFSGATLAELNRVGTGLADQEYDQFLNRMEGTRGMGMSAAGSIADAWGNYGANALNIQNTYGQTAQGINNQFGANRQNNIDRYGNTVQGINAQHGATRQNIIDQYGNVVQGVNNQFGSNLQNIIGNYTDMQNANVNTYGTNMYNAAGVRGSNIQNAWGGVGAGEQNAAALYSSGANNAYQFQGNALANQGDAAAAGAIGGTNAIINGIQNGWGMYNYNRQPQSQTPASQNVTY